MASVVDICNLALSHLGDRATLISIEPPEGSSQADHCARWWPIARDEALASHDWGFASRIETTALLSASEEDHPGWAYAYSRPAGYLVGRELQYSTGATVMLEPGSPLFEEGTLANGTSVLYANTDLAALRYTRVVSDASRYPPKFVVALSYLMASYLAGPVIKGKAGVAMGANARAAWERLKGEAAVLDSNQRHNTTAFKPAGMRARGSTAGGTTTIEDGQYRHELPYWAQS